MEVMGRLLSFFSSICFSPRGKDNAAFFFSVLQASARAALARAVSGSGDSDFAVVGDGVDTCMMLFCPLLFAFMKERAETRIDVIGKQQISR